MYMAVSIDIQWKKRVDMIPFVIFLALILIVRRSFPANVSIFTSESLVDCHGNNYVYKTPFRKVYVTNFMIFCY